MLKDFDEVGHKAGLSFGSAVKGALLGATVGIIAFGAASVKAFSDAQQAQTKFDFAFSKFPKLADVSRASLEKLAETESRFTKFSKLAFLGAESQLAAFNLTGKQVSQLIPIVADYAARTGRDLPEAATLVGRALLGNTRALKEVGINLSITKDKTVDLGKAQKDVADAQQNLSFLEERQAAKKKLTIADTQALTKAQEKLKTAQDKLNVATATGGKVTSTYDKVFGALRDKVGGFAAKQGKTLAGQLDILRNQFEEIRVKVGAVIVGALTPLVGLIVRDLVPAIQKLFGWLQQIGAVVGPAAGDAVRSFFQGFDGPEAQNAKSNVKTLRDDSITLKDVLDSFTQDVLPHIRDGFSAFGELLRTSIIPNVKLTASILYGAGVQAEHTVRDIIGAGQAIVRAFTGAGVQAEHAVRDVIGAFEAVGGFFSDLPGRIVHAIGDINHTMFVIGHNILTSLLNGAIAVFNSGEWGKFWNGVGSWIVDHKGPPSKDRLLLFKSGQAIMDGLRSGFASQIPALAATLAEVTGAITAPSLRLGADGSATVAAGSVRGGNTTIIERQEIHTAATDSRVLANDILYRAERSSQR